VDLLKVYIEGAEWPLLEGGALQAASDCLIGELTSSMAGGSRMQSACSPGST
jgi:hypothetical protein